MTIYRASTSDYTGHGYLLQQCYDSDTQEFFVILYNHEGHKIKNCDRCVSEKGAMTVAMREISSINTDSDRD